MAKITWADRTDIKTALGVTYEAAAAFYNEIKAAINALYDTTEPSTWYVHSAPKGDDSNVGSDKFPFAGIQKAVNSAADGDVIIFQNHDYSTSIPITIPEDKKLTFKGVSAYSSLESIKLSGTWAIDSDIVFENINVNNMSLVLSRTTEFDCNHGRVAFASTTDRHLRLNCLDSEFFLTNTTQLYLLDLKNSTGGVNSGHDLTIGRGLLMDASTIVGNVVNGVDVSSLCRLKNSLIDGDATVTGNLIKQNSVITGTETVSGSTTEKQQTQRETIKIPLGARDTAHTTGTNKVGLHIDYNFTFIGLPTLEFDPIITDGGPTGNAFVVDINIADIDGANEASILSTKLSVDAGEFHSSTAATPCVLSSNTIAKYKFISIDIDTIGGTLAGKGGFVTFPGYRT